MAGKAVSPRCLFSLAALRYSHTPACPDCVRKERRGLTYLSNLS